MRSMINGKFDSMLSCTDRGFQYGDGIFETIAVFNGEAWNWRFHWQRLCEGCKRLFLPLPNEMQLLSEIDNVLLGINKEIVKIIISRGNATRGYAFKDVTPTRVVSAFDWPEYPADNYDRGIELFICKTPIAKQPALAGIKHLNRLENVLARNEWDNPNIAEGIMLDTDNNIIEGTMSNLFLVKNKKLHTPDLSQCGVLGVMRQQLIHLADAMQIPVEIGAVSMAQLTSADEVFVCNSIIEVWPVKKINETSFTIFDSEDTTNSVTRLLQKSIR